MPVGNDAIQQFVNSGNAGDRLIVRDNELHLISKGNLSGWTCFKAKFGCGEASMKKVAAYINKNRNNLFPDEDKIAAIHYKNAMNDFIADYNVNRTFSFKKGKQIKAIESETIAFFGVKEWAKAGYVVKDAPPIPANLQQIYSAPCSIWENNTKGDTHILFLVPKMLNDKKTTHNRLRKIAKKVCPLLFHRTNNKVLKGNDGHKSFTKSYWVLMTKNIVPISKGMVFDWSIVPDNYELPSLIEADICMLTQYLRGRTITDQSQLMFQDNKTYCNAFDSNAYRMLVGGCNQKGFSVGGFIPSSSNGMAAVQRLSSRY